MIARLALVASAALTLASCGDGASQIRAMGSSTVYPFTSAVADAFVAAKSGRKNPVIESVGTGPGIMRFCEGLGGTSPDIADASRRMRRAEFDKCRANRVGEIIEVIVGLDGVALAESNAGPKLRLSGKDIYLALAANPLGKPNAAKNWKDINPTLPAIPIMVMGPPATSGTRDAFVELILEPGCLEAMPEARQLRDAGDPAKFEAACRQIRADGAFVEKGEDDNVVVQALAQNPNAIGLFGYSYLERNASRLQGIPINGVAPDYDSIASGKYPGARTLYLYVKKKHLDNSADLKEFLKLYAQMWGPGGPLAKKGLIAASDAVRRRSAEAIELSLPLDPSALP